MEQAVSPQTPAIADVDFYERQARALRAQYIAQTFRRWFGLGQETPAKSASQPTGNMTAHAGA